MSSLLPHLLLSLASYLMEWQSYSLSRPSFWILSHLTQPVYYRVPLPAVCTSLSVLFTLLRTHRHHASPDHAHLWPRLHERSHSCAPASSFAPPTICFSTVKSGRCPFMRIHSCHHLARNLFWLSISLRRETEQNFNIIYNSFLPWTRYSLIFC